MSGELLSSEQSARRLSISVLTLYDWLNQSDAGAFTIRGRPVTISYYQGGRRGQGRIKIDAAEIERLLSMMRVTPKPSRSRKHTRKTTAFRHITARPGRPED